MQQKLLAEFSFPDYEQWRRLVEQQLKGVPFEKKLLTHTAEGLTIHPLYTLDMQQADDAPLPGSFPFKRSVKATGCLNQGWQIAHHYTCPQLTEFNQAVRTDLDGGLTTVSFSLDKSCGRGKDPDMDADQQVGIGGLSIMTKEELNKAFEEIDLSSIHLQVNPRLSFLPFFSILFAALDDMGVEKDQLKGNMISDPLAELAISGSLPGSLDDYLDAMANCIKWAAATRTPFTVLGVDLRPYSDSGAGAVLELGAALATGVEYLRELHSRNIEVEGSARQMAFYFGIDADFFVNIAKFRAARKLWARVVSLSGGSEDAGKMTIFASTSAFNKTLYDPHVNLLRTTTEAYSAVLAGCDSVAVMPYDQVFGMPDDFSRRIARNIQMVLKEECHGHRVIDPGGGARYLESLTEQLCEKAWAEFQDIEKRGGMSASLQEGIIQQKVEAVVTKKKREVGQRKRVIVGTSMYANQEEELTHPDPFDDEAFRRSRTDAVKSYKASLDIDLPDDKNPGLNDQLMDTLLAFANKGATIGQLSQILCFKSTPVSAVHLPASRLASEYEALRQKSDAYKAAHGVRPQIFLINMGPLKQHKARADFSIGFLQPAGFEVISPDGFQTIDSAVGAALSANTKIAVICSTDETYPDLVPAIAVPLKEAKPDLILVLAGYPKDHIDVYKKSGIDAFIHLKADNLETLKEFQQKAGV